ncbi:DUF6778 family protein [Sulfitobacter sp. D35]|uniref:DUF6778 family protein n=1 Tax=Sulfitobacter sp. D35 TaxID=3083252 RepID=UPI00296F7C41|nr:DUF6778 family protein [Sulfitobacter sp. D35]MDW4497689.1 DUF6778 family protein [Sulfitobacter sp. D35]
MRLNARLNALILVLSLAGCAAPPYPGAPRLAAGQETSPDVTVQEVTVAVPRSLTVSEESTYYPAADIVWRGEPRGDRYAQVTAIFAEAGRRAVRPLSGTRKVAADIEVTRFHSVTEVARYTVGGVHSITFEMLMRDASTGAPLGPRRVIKADLRAFGGQKAVDADAAGQTQKVRIIAHLETVIRSELVNPDAYGSTGG